MSTFTCPNCDGNLVLKYGTFGAFFGCSNYPECDTTDKVDSFGLPYGKPSNKELRMMRYQVNILYNSLWKSGKMAKKAARAWLAKELGINSSISEMDIATCQRVVTLVTHQLQKGVEILDFDEMMLEVSEQIALALSPLAKAKGHLLTTRALILVEEIQTYIVRCSYCPSMTLITQSRDGEMKVVSTMLHAKCKGS